MRVRDPQASLESSAARTSLRDVRSLLLAACLLTACAGTNVTAVYRSTTPQPAPHRVMVVGMFSSPTARARFESHMAALLAARGLRAESSVRWLRHPMRVGPAQLRRVLTAHGFDAVLVGRPIGVTFPTTARGTVMADLMPGTDSEPDWDSPTYRLETALYSARDPARMLWSVTTETEDPASTLQMIDDAERKVVETLAERGLL